MSEAPRTAEKGTNSEVRPPLLGLIDLARLELEKLVSPGAHAGPQEQAPGASNHLTKQVLKYWSRTVTSGCPSMCDRRVREDPEGMRDGTNIWGEVEDKKHPMLDGGSELDRLVSYGSSPFWLGTHR